MPIAQFPLATQPLAGTEYVALNPIGKGPFMPNVVGLNLSEATDAMESAGVLNTNLLGYFGTWPITVNWIEDSNEPNAVPADIVVAQNPFFTATIPVNSPVTLTVSNPIISVAYP